jgi:hypothetical protein
MARSRGKVAGSRPMTGILAGAAGSPENCFRGRADNAISPEPAARPEKQFRGRGDSAILRG